MTVVPCEGAVTLSSNRLFRAVRSGTWFHVKGRNDGRRSVMVLLEAASVHL
jgi:hypothetical protein